MFVELRELLCSGAIRRHQLGAKDLLTPTSSYDGLNGISCCSARCLCGIMESMVCQGCPRNGEEKVMSEMSHGHYDHSGGLMKFVSVNPSANIYMRENAGGEYYSFKEGKEKYIGIDKAILTLQNLHLIKNNTVIDEELSVFTNVHPERKCPRATEDCMNGKLCSFSEQNFFCCIYRYFV